MKVLCVIPPEISYIEASASARIDRKREPRPNLGILYVASYLEAMRPNYEVRVIDAASEGLQLTKLAELIREYQPEVVGLTALTFTFLDALAVARVVKKVNPKTWVVFGGRNPTYYPRETLRQPGVDLVVMGEGEITFAEVCDRLADDLARPDLADVKGIAYRDRSGEIRVNPPAPGPAHLDELPPPNYNLVNIKSYEHVLGRNPVTLSLQTSRGCPFGCTFCDIRRSTLRQRSPDSVVAEIQRWYRQGVRTFFFADDNFVLNKKWTLETCEKIAAQGLKIDFKISARVDLPDLEMYRALKRAGCSRVNFGVESGNQNNLDYLNKGTTVPQIASAFRQVHQAGLKGFAYMIIGFPGQTIRQMYDELIFLNKIRADYASFAVLSPYPQTELYRRLLTEGLIPYDFWQDFAEHPSSDFTMPISFTGYSRKELRRTQVRLTQIFYFNPLFLFRTALSLRNFTQMKNHAKIALNLIWGK